MRSPLGAFTCPTSEPNNLTEIGSTILLLDCPGFQLVRRVSKLQHLVLRIVLLLSFILVYRGVLTIAMSLIQLPVSLLALLSITRLVSADCYVAAYNLVGKQSGWVACPGTASSPGGAETCCIPGSECGEDSICHVPASQNPGSDAWYVAGTYITGRK